MAEFLRMLPGLLLEILIALIREPWEFLKLLAGFDCSRLGEQEVSCLPLPTAVLRKPDPLIYSQSYLASLGIAVVWDNPDITLMQNGVPVDPHDLQPDTDYQVAIRVHNGSNEAPALGVNVQLSYHRWGVGGPPTFVGETMLELPVRGAPGEPATVILPWHTPVTSPNEDHWCLDAVLQYSDDLNPLNNVGQTNVTIRKASPGDAVSLNIAVSHELSVTSTLRRQTTSYSLPSRALYPPIPPDAPERYEQAIERLGKNPSLAAVIAANRVTGQPAVDNWTAYQSPKVLRSGLGKGKAPKQYGEDWLPRIVSANSPSAHPPPPAWQATIVPDQVTIDPDKETTVELRVVVPQDAAPSTEQLFQVNAFDELDGLVGGIEVLVSVR